MPDFHGRHRFLLTLAAALAAVGTGLLATDWSGQSRWAAMIAAALIFSTALVLAAIGFVQLGRAMKAERWYPIHQFIREAGRTWDSLAMVKAKTDDGHLVPESWEQIGIWVGEVRSALRTIDPALLEAFRAGDITEIPENVGGLLAYVKERVAELKVMLPK